MINENKNDKEGRNQRQRKIFLNLFEIAGFKSLVLRNIPNQYCLDENCTVCSDWFYVKTEVGTILIGWRKRVINIDWSETGKDLDKFFWYDNTTQWEHGIHAWGYHKVLEYITKLHQYLSYNEDGLERYRETVKLTIEKHKEKEGSAI